MAGIPIVFFEPVLFVTHFRLWCFLLQYNRFKLLKYDVFDRKVDELDKAISVASRDPSWYGIDEVEIETRKRWTNDARTQVSVTC